jgi:hypothetical protein
VACHQTLSCITTRNSQPIAQVVQLLDHENNDIALAAVEVIMELTDIEALTDAESDEGPKALVDALVEHACLELLVRNLGKLDETDDDAQKGVYNTLSVPSSPFPPPSSFPLDRCFSSSRLSPRSRSHSSFLVAHRLLECFSAGALFSRDVIVLCWCARALPSSRAAAVHVRRRVFGPVGSSGLGQVSGFRV